MKRKRLEVLLQLAKKRVYLFKVGKRETKIQKRLKKLKQKKNIILLLVEEKI